MGIFQRETASDYLKKAVKKFQTANKESKSDFNEIQRILLRSSFLEPKNAEIYFMKGWMANHFSQFKYAISQTNMAISLNPEYADAYCSRGWSKLELDDLNGALQDFEKAIQLKPDFQIANESRENVLKLLSENRKHT